MNGQYIRQGLSTKRLIIAAFKKCKISSEERKMVFSLVSKEFELTLDVKAAQSSINHVIMGSASLARKWMLFVMV